MTDFVKSKPIRGLNTYKETILVVVAVTLIMVILTGCEEVYTPGPQQSVTLKEPFNVSVSTSAEIGVLSEQIKQLVIELDYPEEAAKDFVNMVNNWKDTKGQPELIAWKMKLVKAKEEYQQGKISKDKLSKVEESVAKEVCHRIKKQVRGDGKTFDLINIIKHKQAQCMGYAQLIYIVGNSIGLSVRSLNVLEYVVLEYVDPVEVEGTTHVACIIYLFDERVIIADVLFFPDLISSAFKLENQFIKVGNYWELRNKENSLRIHRRVQVGDIKANLYVSRGTRFQRSGQYLKAISNYKKAIELDPKLALAYNDLGGVYYILKQHSKAISHYNKAIELDPKFSFAYNNRGAAYGDLGEHDKGISDYTKALEINPKSTQAYYNMGDAYYAKGEYDRAISVYNKAIEINPKHADAYHNLGVVYYIKGEYDQAISNYTKALEINPRHAEAYYNRGFAYQNKGIYDQAILDHTKAIEINPKYTKAYYSRGMSYSKKGDYDQAISNYTKALEINPRHAQAYYNRGNAYKAKDKYDRAILDHTKAIETNPRYAFAYYSRGTAYYAKGEYYKSISDFNKAIEITPRLAEAYYSRGVIYAAFGKSKEAKKDLLKAVELNPSLKSRLKQISDKFKLGL